MDLTNMSSKELEELQNKWYNEACEQGKIAKLYHICRYLGNRLSSNYGPKYEYRYEYMTIFADDYGGYMTVKYDGKEVCSTHYCDKLYIPGKWEYVIDHLYLDAKAIEQYELQNREDINKKKLLDRLSL